MAVELPSAAQCAWPVSGGGVGLLLIRRSRQFSGLRRNCLGRQVAFRADSAFGAISAFDLQGRFGRCDGFRLLGDRRQRTLGATATMQAGTGGPVLRPLRVGIGVDRPSLPHVDVDDHPLAARIALHQVNPITPSGNRFK